MANPLAKGMHAKSNVLHAAAFHGAIDEIIKLPGNDPKTVALANARDSLGRSPLGVAVREAHLHVAEALVTLGAQVDAAEDDKAARVLLTPLMLAARTGQLAMCAMLLRRGADLHLTSSSSSGSPGAEASALEMARRAGHEPVAELLRTCLEASMRKGRSGVVEICSRVLGRSMLPPPPPGLPPIRAASSPAAAHEQQPVAANAVALFTSGGGGGSRGGGSAGTDTATALMGTIRVKSKMRGLLGRSKRKADKSAAAQSVDACAPASGSGVHSSASTPVLREINTLRRYIREERAMSQDHALLEQERQFADRERRWRAELRGSAQARAPAIRMHARSLHPAVAPAYPVIVHVYPTRSNGRGCGRRSPRYGLVMRRNSARR